MDIHQLDGTSRNCQIYKKKKVNVEVFGLAKAKKYIFTYITKMVSRVSKSLIEIDHHKSEGTFGYILTITASKANVDEMT